MPKRDQIEPDFISIASVLRFHEGRQSAGLYGEPLADAGGDDARVRENLLRLGLDITEPRSMAAIAAGAIILLDFQRSISPAFLQEGTSPPNAPLETYRPDMQPTVTAANIIGYLLRKSIDDQSISGE